MGDVLKEAAAIRVAMGELGWDYIGGGPYPSAPQLQFYRGDQVLSVAVGPVGNVTDKEQSE